MLLKLYNQLNQEQDLLNNHITKLMNIDTVLNIALEHISDKVTKLNWLKAMH